MALWKESAQKDTFFGDNDKPGTDVMPTASTVRPRAHSEGGTKETVISAGLTVEGKIEGEGNVRIAGRFQGDVHVEGDLTVEPGAHISGEIHAETVTIGGEVEGNVEATTRVGAHTPLHVAARTGHQAVVESDLPRPSPHRFS